ncbi:MAG: ABC transporter ATP-binding protein [Bryobacteraceae bacterium]|jgi:ATP-binding cassette subfamily B protein
MLKVWRRAFPYLWRYRRALFLGMASLIMKDVMGAALPLAIGAGVDSLVRGFQLASVTRLAALMVGLSLAKGIFMYWMRVILVGMSRDVEYDLRNDLFAHMIRLSSDFFARYRVGDIMARATNDLNAVRMALGPGVMYWAETVFTLIFAVAIMVKVDWVLAVTVLIPAPVVSLVVVYFGRRIHDRFEKIQALFSDISSRVQENLSGVRVVRAYVQEKAELEKFESLNLLYVDQNIRLARLSALFNPLLQALVGVMFLIVLWAGGYRMLNHHITLGQFVMFNTFMGLLVWPMIAMGWVVNLMQRGKASWGRIMELMDERPAIAAPPHPARLPERLRGEVRFDGVEVRYSTGTALQRVDLEIPAGATVAVVGHTGSGKSTLVSLIPRLLDTTAGSVLVDGLDVRALDPEELRRQIGFVPQETFLFSATLARNIAWGVPGADRASIERAATLAGLAADIAGFPDGLETMVGERGLTLSGGQKQRTAITRALLRDPRILILDDALSSVDTVTEERILEGLTQIMHGRTTILISHRVSTVRHADRIFVLEHGELVEQGTHAELIGNGGYYADLYQKQLLEEELEAI